MSDQLGAKTKITTRLATPDDAATVHTLTQAAFDSLRGKIDPPSSAHRETVHAVVAALTTGSGGVAEIGGEPVGAVRFRRAGDHLYIGRVSVEPGSRGLGVARALMALAERHAASLGLPETRVEVRRALSGNVAMFERLGYRIVAEYPHPKRHDATVVMLAKPVVSAESVERVDG